MNNKRLNKFRFVITYGILIGIILMLIYLGLLPLTFISNSFRFWLLVLPILITLPFVIRYQTVYRQHNPRPTIGVSVDHKMVKRLKPVYTLVGVIFVGYIVLNIIAMPLLGTERYQTMIDVDESDDFTANINELSQTKVPIVDEALAFRLGDKKLGEYKGMGSQFTINDYTMIDVKGELYWVGALEYTGFFKWLNNKDEGVPGYIRISATNPSQVELIDYPMFYVPSAYFGQDLLRNIYFSGNMTKLFDPNTAFELDEEGHPYYVKTVVNKRFAFTKGRDTVGVVVLDAVTGDVAYYDVEDAPDWIDRIQPTDIIIDQLGYYGKYVHGYLNTVFAKREVLQVSEGYSYIFNDGRFYLYTGLTSVGADESIVGFTLTDVRTKETKFYRIGGATEFSAQNSAQGAVQDLGYRANWPILVNFQNIPTYFMALKDDEGLIKKYAYIKVNDYSVYGIGNTLAEAQNNYLKNLSTADTDPNAIGTKKSLTATVVSIEQIMIEGTSFYYLMLDGVNDKLFIASYNISYELPITAIGDSINITYYETEGNVYTIELLDNLNYHIDDID